LNNIYKIFFTSEFGTEEFKKAIHDEYALKTQELKDLEKELKMKEGMQNGKYKKTSRRRKRIIY